MMAQPIIKMFEFVNVEEQERERRLFPPGEPQFGIEAFKKRASIRASRQCVGPGESTLGRQSAAQGRDRQSDDDEKCGIDESIPVGGRAIGDPAAPIEAGRNRIPAAERAAPARPNRRLPNQVSTNTGSR